MAKKDSRTIELIPPEADKLNLSKRHIFGQIKNPDKLVTFS